ncbi:Hypothetical protein R9X50_00188900 [Acrodontium crateriforme]|uniref:Cytochrome P450 n=1 Tax=Acrodontium crateriforme TaxID=150365 RepID=A0AAQ3LZS8_9PEZI|nr:Hypothetical protein R9X50_00188900 [Acrodontium crateriforme]
MALKWRQLASATLAGHMLLLTVCNGKSRLLTGQHVAVSFMLYIVGSFVWTAFIYPRFISPLRHLPQPTQSHWLLGHRSWTHPTDMGIDGTKWVNEIPHHHFIRFLDYFNRDSLLVTSAEAIGEILTEKDDLFPRSVQSRYIFSRYVGDGIAIAEGDEHKAQRRALSLAFSARHIRDLYPLFWAKSAEAVRAVTKKVAASSSGRTTIECHSWAVRCALDAMGTAGMGLELGTIQDEDHALVRAYEDLKKFSWQDALMILLGTALPKRFVASLPLRRNCVIDASRAQIYAVCRRAVRRKQNARDDQESGHVDICSTIVNSGLFHEEDAIDQLMVMLFASHHAPARSLTGAFYALSCAPEKQERLRDEVRRRLPSIDDSTQITHADIESMPYLQAVCKEVLRKYSTGVASREAACDVTIQGNVIPKGTAVKLAVMSANADPNLWGDDANDFRPERWLSDDEGSDRAPGGQDGTTALGGAASKYAYMAFLHGPRNCIAARFAEAELACFLATWVGRFKFTLADQRLADERNLPARAMETKLEVCTEVVEGW